MAKLHRITLEQFHERLRAQKAPSRADLALVCPMCGAVQSMRSLIAAGAGENEEDVEPYLGFSCVGRWTNAGPPPREKTGSGCDWTLGGLFSLHTLEVELPDGVVRPTFEVASPEQCAQLAARLRGDQP